MPDRSDHKPIRWWPLVVIWGLAVAGLLVLNRGGDDHRQGIVMISLGVIAAAVSLSFLWLLAFSRLSWKRRLTTAAMATLVVVVVGSQLRIEGVSGDLVPIVKWRWSKSPDRTPKHDEIQSSIASLNEHIDIADYPQFLGPGRNAKVDGPNLARDWQQNPPQKLWRQPIGAAWSAFSVSGRRAITQEQDGEDEMVVCYDLLTGTVLWEHENKTRYFTGLGGEGPRATPTIDLDRVYTLGATGVLNCLDLETGRALWTRQIMEENGAMLPDWGYSGSPLIYENLVVVSAGGPENRSLVAYDKISGEPVWSAGNDGAHWSSPVSYEIAGTKQILIFNASGVAAHDVSDGSILWEFPWKRDHPHVSLPVLLPGDRVLISSGYGNGAALLQISRNEESGAFTAEQVWKSLRLKAKFTNVVFKDGYIYGLDDGALVCLDVETGRTTWKGERYGHGQVILAGDLLLLTAENGEVVLIDPVPEEARELASFQAIEGKSWNPPALAGPYLVVRNHLEAACYRLPTIRVP